MDGHGWDGQSVDTTLPNERHKKWGVGSSLSSERREQWRNDTQTDGKLALSPRHPEPGLIMKRMVLDEVK